MAKASAAEINAKVEWALEDVRLMGFGKRHLNELSGGQKQRVALACALVTPPRCCCSTSRWRSRVAAVQSDAIRTAPELKPAVAICRRRMGAAACRRTHIWPGVGVTYA
jgi:ABC-type microcin C transport system duplicated ATPase subunit YejF